MNEWPTSTPRIPWAWMALAVLVIVGAGVPEVATLMRWTMTLAMLYLLLTHYPQVQELMDRFLGGLIR